MSLGGDLAPHLPFLRRYARSLTGSQAEGDAYVRATLEAIVANPGNFPREVDARLGLYRFFQVTWQSSLVDSGGGDGQHGGPTEAIAHARLARITPRSRQALLLTAMEGFTNEDVAYLLAAELAEVETLVADALDEIERQTRAEVLIIEDEPIIAMDLETVVRDLGHGVTGVASTRDEAVALATARRPGLILADIQLADDSSGIDAINDILAKFEVPVIFITGFPDRLLSREQSGPLYLITKPFKRAIVKTAISQALFFNDATVALERETGPISVPQSAEVAADVQSAARSISAVGLSSTPSPLHTEVVGQILRRAPARPASAPVGLGAMNHLRETLRRSTNKINADLEGRNDAGPLRRKLDDITSVLSEPLSQESSLSIGVSVNGLMRILPALSETMMDLPLAEISVLAFDLEQFVQNFPLYRHFRAEAESGPPLTPDTRSAVIAVARTLVSAGDEVEPEVKRVLMNAVTAVGVDGGAPIADYALLVMVADILKAIARWAKDLLLDVGKGVRKALVNALSSLAVALPVGGALTILKVQYPTMYASAVGALILFRSVVKDDGKSK